jgi:hypothetical protein
MTVHEFVQCSLHGLGQVGCNNSLTIAGDPFFHSVHYELLFRNSHELALFGQPIELDCADHHPQGATGLIRLLWKRCRIIIPHKLDRSRATGWIHQRLRGLRHGFNPGFYTICGGAGDSPVAIIDCPRKHRSSTRQNTGWKLSFIVFRTVERSLIATPGAFAVHPEGRRDFQSMSNPQG